MVRRLRNQVDGLGLLYGQGEFVTKHHALVLASTAPQVALSQDYSVQSIVEARRGVIPELLGTYEGRASVETFTLVHQRDGAVEFGFVIARTPQGQRLLARVPADDERTVAVLTDPLRSPVGRDGQVSQGNNGLLQWSSER
ncbi:acetyl-CoA acetyltransferase [compost metagenome]